MRLWLLAFAAGMMAQCATAKQQVWPVDPIHSKAQVGISLRLPMHPEGTFKSISGEMKELSAQDMSVHLVLNTQDLQMSGARWIQTATVSKPFLDIANYPQIIFQSEAFPSQVLITGGAMQGTLTLKGLKRSIVFAVSPTTCHRPGFSCPIVGNGQINRHDFGMNANPWTVRDEVRFSFQLKFTENE